MSKKWIVVASTLIAIGIIGLLFSKFDISNSNSASFEHEWEYGGVTIEAIDVRGSSTNIDITFTDSPDQNTYIVVKGETEDQIYEQIKSASINGNTFTLNMDGQGHMRWISFGIERNNIEMSVALPNNQILNEMKLITSSGDASISNLYAKQANIQASSGDIVIDESTIENSNVEAASGHITLLSHQGDIVAKITSGDVKINQLEGNSRVKSTSGDISIEQQKEGDMTVEATSGDVDLTQRITGNATVETTSGRIEMKLSEQFAGAIHTSSNSGTIKTPKQYQFLGTPSIHQISLKTTSGDIRIKQ